MRFFYHKNKRDVTIITGEDGIATDKNPLEEVADYIEESDGFSISKKISTSLPPKKISIKMLDDSTKNLCGGTATFSIGARQDVNVFPYSEKNCSLPNEQNAKQPFRYEREKYNSSIVEKRQFQQKGYKV